MSDDSPFTILCDLLRPYSSDMTVQADTENTFLLEEERSGEKPQMFARVHIGKRYTSFHLMPIYCHPGLLDGMSEQLRKRMQGKSCFNFTSGEQIPRDELQDLIRRSYESL
ncbi:DUF1801 domain-containing protein [Notoacmeibacter sp. MSK16QG-6]|uniref:DUF1801 domain-containing protein n=1 Tax=Notoacmeibacter sp. MSK16QG-6 TaxID=2957982 RepID=UPI00209D084A|nr:DUF1801 domain-containing protein [Notoacmeibacter sp. MSK16QG-6]MCP1198209.1 DUF1801 domain-containing protein [Notoacmeibacter sp. MSK16QG-6]